MLVHVAASRLAADGRVWIYGANDEGAGSIRTRMEAHFDSVRTISSGGRCRLVEACGLSCTPRGSMEDWRQPVQLDHPSLPERWISYPGCFAHGRLDEGTRLLIDNLPSVEPYARVLDFGCGTGVVAAAVRAAQPEVSLTLLDNDALALEAAEENVPEAEVVLSDGLAELEAGLFGLIVGNPPYHEGKAGTHTVIDSVCEAAPGRIDRGGSIVLVVQRTFSLGRVLERYFRDVVLRAEGGSYRVWEASRPN
jgi:16S rRNA (guanine1207-N2)-methyltransferase